MTSSDLDWLAVFGYLGITLFVMWRVLAPSDRSDDV